MFESAVTELGFKFGGDLHTEILVMGGGFAGIGAAVGAAKCGAEVLLIEKYGFLGGMATTAAVSTICGAYSADKESKIIGGVRDELFLELGKLGGAKEGLDFGQHRADTCDHHLLKVAIDRLLAHYENIQLLLHTQVIGVKKESGSIQYAIITNKEGVFRVFAKTFVDCTGDADVVPMVDAPYVIGNEKGQVQAATTIFKMGDVDLKEATAFTRQQYKDLAQASIDKGEYAFTRTSGVYMESAVGNSIIANLNWISFSAIDAKQMTEAEIEGRRSSIEYSQFLRDKIPGFKNAHLSEIATQIGIRESRRIVAEFVLTEEHVMQGATFEDGICWGAWPVEYHDAVENKTIKTYLKQNYQIPYRTMIPGNVDNLLVAGRSISTTHFANASTRVMSICMAIGQAAGVACVISMQDQVLLKNIDTNKLKKQLREQGAII
ncbi:FAD-dependent oxidoreductase [Brevibacillus panacihumi]|uniref:FAD-dependent oxidoreductase n=1 Tax=Brevibacillus panacihumi TaxID=497735 RepID=UPI003D244B02